MRTTAKNISARRDSRPRRDGARAGDLALHPPRQFRGHAEKVQDRAKDMIEYIAEDPWIRQKFEGELAKRGLTTLMPADAYSVDNYDWHPGKVSL